MKTKIFIFLLIVAVAIAIFSAGQLFLVLQNPELVFAISIAGIVLLSVGFFLGKDRKEDGDCKNCSSFHRLFHRKKSKRRR